MTAKPFRVRSRSDSARKAVHASDIGVYRNSWFSAAWTRVRGTVAGVASAVPIVGSPLAGAISSLHTGDEHQDANGNWVSNSTGGYTNTMDPNLQNIVDQTRAFEQAELARLRQQAADTAAQIGYGATTQAAARIGPDGNVYQQALNIAGNPVYLAAAVAAVILIIVIMRKK